MCMIKGLEQQVRKASHCGNKQQYRAPDEITLLFLVCATYILVLFLPHTPFVVYCAFNTAPNKQLQHFNEASS